MISLREEQGAVVERLFSFFRVGSDQSPKIGHCLLEIATIPVHLGVDHQHLRALSISGENCLIGVISALSSSDIL